MPSVAAALAIPMQETRKTIENCIAELLEHQNTLPSLVVAACRPSQVIKRRSQTGSEEGKQEENVLGIILADDDILFSYCYGESAPGVPASIDVPYSLASITKPITATAVMALCHKLDRQASNSTSENDTSAAARPLPSALKRPITHVLRDAGVKDWAAMCRPCPGSSLAENSGSQPTIEQVLSHTAGLPQFFTFYYADEAASCAPREEALRKHCWVCTRPGLLYRYSNLGYGLLDFLVSKLTSLPFAQAMDELVFSPLGMTRSAIGPVKDVANAARYGVANEVLPLYELDHSGGSSAYASARDLLKFGVFHATSDESLEAVLPAALRADMQILRAAAYALGWASASAPIKRVFHNGAMGGVRTDLSLYPDSDLVVVVLVNAQPSDAVGKLVETIVALVRDALCLQFSTPIAAAAPQARAQVSLVPSQLPPDNPLRSLLEGEWRGKVWHKPFDEPGNMLEIVLTFSTHGSTIVQFFLSSRADQAAFGAASTLGLLVNCADVTEVARIPGACISATNPLVRFTGIIETDLFLRICPSLNGQPHNVQCECRYLGGRSVNGGLV